MVFTADRVFDTHYDTRKNHGTLTTRFSIRKDVKVDGKCPVYLNINGNERRINLKIYVNPDLWLRDKRRLKVIDNNIETSDINLILDVAEAKLTSIKATYRIAEIPITAELLENEFLNKLSRVNFIAFFKSSLEIEKNTLTTGSYNRHRSVLEKLTEYKSNIPFHDINSTWIKNYRIYLKKEKHNQETTISANIASIKKFLGIAQKSGVRLMIDLQDLKAGSTKGNRTYLNEVEVKKCFEYYKSDFISERNQLILGYFLFGCFTGLRISNIQKLRREELMNNDVQLIMVKGNKDKNVVLNSKVKEIINHVPELFERKFTDQHMNDEIKKIMRSIGITKKVTFHVSRHTFATLFLKIGGKVEILQQLLGHSSITQTMVYVHIVQAEANKEVFLLDKLF